MNKMTLLLLSVMSLFKLSAQQYPQIANLPTITISGKVIDKETATPLEYATLVLQSVRFPERITGGITDVEGIFSVETLPGPYNISVEFISFTSYTQENVRFTENTNLGTITLAANVEQLDNVELVAERTTVELRLDKKVYNVGQDLTVKGGTVTDVLDNVPSVSVDVEGNISLRGNGSVQILINGKPSALSGLSTDALQQLPADAIERVEIITNPSARYDAEGSAGIINIILRQEKTKGINGSVTAYVGSPENTGSNLNLNLRRKTFNLFSNTSYRKTNSPGNGLNEQINYDLAGTILSYQNETSRNDRLRDGFNTNLGLEILFNPKTSLTQTFFYRTQEGQNISRTEFFNFDANFVPTISRLRLNIGDETDTNYQYAINFVKDFQKSGHKFTADFQYSTGEELGDNNIEENVNEDNEIFVPSEYTFTGESQINRLFQFDYVLPLGDKGQGQFEAGYRGTFNDFYTDFDFEIQQVAGGPLVRNQELSNELEYKEYVNAAYVQLGNKFNKFSVLGGMRYEASDIQVNSSSAIQDSRNEKLYANWFPSVFLGYEISDMEQFTLSYSKRLRRPRSWFINPFIRRNSNTNLFSGNPDLDPAYTDAFDFGYLKRFGKFTLNTSIYYNETSGVFQFIQRETGETVRIDNPDGGFIEVPVQLRSPINLASEYRTGGEVTTSYSPKRGMRFSWNLNLFQQGLEGDFTYTNTNGETTAQVFDTDNFTWFSRVSAQFPLPGKIEFQTNAFYNGNSVNPQGIDKGILSLNLAMSKQILKDKGAISFNVSDLLNSRKRISETRTASVFTASEFQWRQRQATLTFRYQFNEQDNTRKRQHGEMGGEEEFEFGTP